MTTERGDRDRLIRDTVKWWSNGDDDRFSAIPVDFSYERCGIDISTCPKMKRWSP